MKRKRPTVNAGEYLDKLERDPVYQRRLRERAERLNEDKRAYRETAGPLLAELADAGYPVDWITDLPRFYGRYPELVPLLLDFLRRPEYAIFAGIREEIVRALSLRWVGPVAGPPLIKEFLAAEGRDNLRWAVGNALGEVGGEDVLPEMLRIARDRRYGKTRQVLVNGLGRFRTKKVTDTLIELLADDDVVAHAAYALGNAKDPSVMPHLEALSSHPRKLARTEAKKAIKKLEKAAKRAGIK